MTTIFTFLCPSYFTVAYSKKQMMLQLKIISLLVSNIEFIYCFEYKMVKLVILLFFNLWRFQLIARRKSLLVVMKATKCGGPFVKKKKEKRKKEKKRNNNWMSVPQQMLHQQVKITSCFKVISAEHITKLSISSVSSGQVSIPVNYCSKIFV